MIPVTEFDFSRINRIVLDSFTSFGEAMAAARRGGKSWQAYQVRSDFAQVVMSGLEKPVGAGRLQECDRCLGEGCTNCEYTGHRVAQWTGPTVYPWRHDIVP